MKTSLINAFVLAAGLAVAAEIETCARAENSSLTAHAIQTSQVARIISVDDSQRTIILQIRDKIYHFQLDPHLTNRQTHQPISLDRLIPGRQISFVSRPLSSGQMAILSLVLLPDSGALSAPAGKKGGPLEVTPFQ
jgi:hypothetical protein